MKLHHWVNETTIFGLINAHLWIVEYETLSRQIYTNHLIYIGCRWRWSEAAEWLFVSPNDLIISTYHNHDSRIASHENKKIKKIIIILSTNNDVRCSKFEFSNLCQTLTCTNTFTAYRLFRLFRFIFFFVSDVSVRSFTDKHSRRS